MTNAEVLHDAQIPHTCYLLSKLCTWVLLEQSLNVYSRIQKGKKVHSNPLLQLTEIPPLLLAEEAESSGLLSEATWLTKSPDLAI